MHPQDSLSEFMKFVAMNDGDKKSICVFANWVACVDQWSDIWLSVAPRFHETCRLCPLVGSTV